MRIYFAVGHRYNIYVYYNILLKRGVRRMCICIYVRYRTPNPWTVRKACAATRPASDGIYYIYNYCAFGEKRGRKILLNIVILIPNASDATDKPVLAGFSTCVIFVAIVPVFANPPKKR